MRHENLFGINKADLTLANVSVNREGNYSSKLLFIEKNNTVENVIFSLFEREVDENGKLIEAYIFFNKLNGEYLFGYKIENGKITKEVLPMQRSNVQKAGFFLFLQRVEDDDDKKPLDFSCWVYSGGELGEVVIYADGGIGTDDNEGSGGNSIDYVSAADLYNFGDHTQTDGISTSGSDGETVISVNSAAGTLLATRTNEDGSPVEEEEFDDTYFCDCNCEGTETEFTNDLEKNMEPKWG